jgi:hypothetical protein
MLSVLAQLAGPTPSSGQRQPSGIGDRQPENLIGCRAARISRCSAVASPSRTKASSIAFVKMY